MTAPARLRTYTHAGLTFDLLDDGPPDGPIVVLLHGFPQTASSWEPTARLLRERGYRTIAPDQRGYSPGARPRGRLAYRTSLLVDDVVALIDTLGGGPVHLAGHDWGAVVAWSLAAARPDLVRTLTSVSVPHPAAFLRSMVSSDQALRSWYMAVFQVPWVPERLVARKPALLERMLERAGMDADAVAEVRRTVVDGGAFGPGLNWYRAMALGSPDALRRKVSVPTTHVWGDRDIALGRRGAELAERYVTGPYRFEPLAGAGHWIPEQNAERLAEIITARITDAQEAGAPH